MHDPGEARKEAKSPWNSLETVKFVTSIATPVAIAFLGLVAWNIQRDTVQNWESRQQVHKQELESRDKERDRVRDLRVGIYKDAAPLLNAIFAYHFNVGPWKELTPANVIEKKRQVDALMFSHEALLSQDFFKMYNAFMRESFRAARNHYGESRIRTKIDCHRPHLPDGEAKWTAWFTNEDNRENICLAYRELLGRLPEELLLHGLKVAAAPHDEKIAACRTFYDFKNCK
jgi:hypothetical protein